MLRGIALVELILMRRKVDLSAHRFPMGHGILRYPDAVLFALERFAADYVVFISILFHFARPHFRSRPSIIGKTHRQRDGWTFRIVRPYRLNQFYADGHDSCQVLVTGRRQSPSRPGPDRA